jgi:hypothetical protein
MSLTYRVLAIFIVVAVIMSLVLGILRLKVENENRRVDIMLDFEDVQYISQSTGHSISQVLALFKDEGVGSIVVNEYTANSFVSMGKVVALSGKDILSYYYMADFPNVFIKRLVEDGAINQYHTYFLMDDLGVFQKLRDDLSLRLSGSDVSTFVFSSYLGKQRYGIDVNERLDEVLDFALGFLNEDLSTISDAGLNVIPRFQYVGSNSLERIDKLFGELSQVDSVSMFMCRGASVLGYDRFLEEVAQRAENMGLIYGDMEFEQPKGESKLIDLMELRAIRIHTITSGEMCSYTVSSAVERFVRGIRERNIRGVYLRLFATDDDDILKLNLDYVGLLRDKLVKTGHIPASPSPFRYLSSDIVSLFGIGLGVVSASILFVHLVFGLSEIFAVILLSISMIAYGSLIVSGYGILARQAMALIAAITFPGLVVFYSTIREKETKAFAQAYGPLRALFGSLGRLCIASAISFIGGMFVVGLLADTVFMLNIKGFVGVKISYILPLLIVALCYFYRFVRRSDEGLFAAFGRAMAEPVRYKYVFVWGIMAVGALVYVIRSGNNPLVQVTVVEDKIRSLLEQQLYARPRMKEVAIGHPFLLLAAYMVLRQRTEGLLLPALILGTVGQVSIINSFAHIHTPLLVTLSRVGYGLVFGAIAGIVLIVVFETACAVKAMSKGTRGVPGD